MKWPSSGKARIATGLVSLSLIGSVLLLAGVFPLTNWPALLLSAMASMLAAFVGAILGWFARQDLYGRIGGAAGALIALGFLFALISSLASPLGDVVDSGGVSTNSLWDDHMKRLEEVGFSGAILVAQKGEVLLSKGYGHADGSTLFRTTTLFDIGSLTKQFTAAAILHLESKGKLRVEDRIDTVLGGSTGITIHELLTHTSGLPDNFGGDYEPMSRDEIVRKALDSKLGPKSHAYSNAGYSLLAAIIEIVSGGSYEAYLQGNLFKPAGMADTGYLGPKGHLAHGYLLFDFDWGTPRDHPWAEDGPWWNLRGNGGILSTVEDLHRWHVALRGGKILPKAALDKMFTAHVPEGGGSHYGYGWAIEEGGWGRVVSHNGSNLIFFADLRYYEEKELLFILGTNRQTHLGMTYADGILDLVLD